MLETPLGLCKRWIDLKHVIQIKLIVIFFTGGIIMANNISKGGSVRHLLQVLCQQTMTCLSHGNNEAISFTVADSHWAQIYKAFGSFHPRIQKQKWLFKLQISLKNIYYRLKTPLLINYLGILKVFECTHLFQEITLTLRVSVASDYHCGNTNNKNF